MAMSFGVIAAFTVLAAAQAGFVGTVRDADGRWWLVDGEGRKTLERGVGYATPRGWVNKTTGRRPYGETVNAKYESVDSWANSTVERMKKWGFNTFGSDSDPCLRHRGMKYTVLLRMGSLFAATNRVPDDWICPRTKDCCLAFPNVFSPKFSRWCRERAEKMCRPNAKDRDLVGYFIDNELAWWGQAYRDGKLVWLRDATTLVDAVTELPPEHTARKALAKFLAERGLSADISATNMPPAVKEAFLALAADRYFATTAAAIRSVDPNHLVLGCRFAGLFGAHPIVWEAAGRHCDVVTVNMYPTIDLEGNGPVTVNHPAERKYVDAVSALKLLQARAGKPVMITEWSFPSFDSGLPCKKGAGQRVKTQGERALAVERFVRTFAALPFVVGYDWFMWTDCPNKGEAGNDGEDCNYGLVNAADEPYREVVETFSRLNREAKRIHAAEAIEVRRVAMPPRAVRGDTNVRRLAPWDSADWIWTRDIPLPQCGEFVRFRKVFSADGRSPLRFHVSADERFVLVMDGNVVARGPDRGTPEMWFVQSYETLPAAGDHVMEAVCWRMGRKQSPNAQLSIRGGFMFKAEDAFDAALTTGLADWRVAVLSGTRMTRAAYPTEPAGAQCEVFGTGLVDERPDASVYAKPIVVRKAIPSDSAAMNGSSRNQGWMLYPSELPSQVERTIRPGAFKAADGQAFATNGVWSKVAQAYGRAGWYRASAAAHPAVRAANGLLSETGALTVPPRTKLRLLWDLGDYYCAYPELSASGGKGARVGWGWAESLFTGDCFDWHTLATAERKGQTSRDKWEDKYFYGTKDVFHLDGRRGATFTTPWWRCGRWCQIEVETSAEPLVIEDLRLVETRYPLAVEGRFECDDPSVGGVERICQRGLEMCMHEMYMDCPYYEQQMYGGDTRLQMLIASAISGDGRLARQSFRLFEMSQRDDGRVSMNYPTTWLQESTTYSLMWTMMLGDYALWHDDIEWVRSRMPAVRKMLLGIEMHVGTDGLLRGLPGWSFMDWVPEWKLGVAPGGGFGGSGSAAENLLYLLALRKATSLEEALGERELAARWRRRAETLARHIEAAFWNEARGMVADTMEGDCFSEHAQSLAILAGALPPDKAARAFSGLVSADDLARCTVYFSHYLFEAYFQFGRGDLFLKKLDLWRGFARQGLRTPLEAPGDARSDCHAWGAHPLYHFRTGLAGIRPTSVGFRTALIAPCPGGLKHIKAAVPTPKGAIQEELRFEGDVPTGTVVVPEGVSARFVWRNVSCNLSPGVNVIDTLIDAGTFRRVDAPRLANDWDMACRTFTNATELIQGSVDDVFRAGGGRVVVGKGFYPVRGLRLRSGVTLYLESGAVLQASRNSADFDILGRDEVEPVSGVAEASNDVWVKPTGNTRRTFVRNALSPWNNAIIRILNAHDVAIIGERGSIIDGANGFDPNGEEGYRGVHGVSAFDSTNITYRGFTIQHTGNWALRHQRCAGIVCDGVTMLAGHDGFHVRECSRIDVRDCFIHTGDDAIAGFANRDMAVRRCDLSSACSALRLGGRDILVEDCRAHGPCEYIFRGSLSPQAKRDGIWDPALVPGRHSMATFFLYFCDFTSPVPDQPGNIVVRNCRVENCARFIRYNFGGETWQHARPLADIRFENVQATGLWRPCALNGGTGEGKDMPLDFSMLNCSLGFLGPQPEVFSVANVRTLALTNVTVTGATAPLVRTWDGRPELKLSNVKGALAEIIEGKGRFVCPMR